MYTQALDLPTPAISDAAAAAPTNTTELDARQVAFDAKMDAALLTSYADALENEVQLQSSLGFGADYAEGVAAFGAKRAPQFSDR